MRSCSVTCAPPPRPSICIDGMVWKPHQFNIVHLIAAGSQQNTEASASESSDTDSGSDDKGEGEEAGQGDSAGDLLRRLRQMIDVNRKETEEMESVIREEQAGV